MLKRLGKIDKPNQLKVGLLLLDPKSKIIYRTTPGCKNHSGCRALVIFVRALLEPGKETDSVPIFCSVKGWEIIAPTPELS